MSLRRSGRKGEPEATHQNARIGRLHLSWCFLYRAASTARTSLRRALVGEVLASLRVRSSMSFCERPTRDQLGARMAGTMIKMTEGNKASARTA